MDYTSKFLDTKGLTTAEANYTANIIKELCERISNEIKQLTLFKGTLNFQGKQTEYNKVYKVENLEEKCLEEGNLYALSAWLREAIKAKEALLKQVENDNFDISLLNEVNYGKATNLLTEDEVKYSLPINELAEYLAYEAKAAHIGKKVHPNGIFEQWFNEIKNTPKVQINEINKDYIVEFDQVVDEKDLYQTYFTLQKEYREAEQKVNYYKAKVKNLLNERNQEINQKNRALQDKLSQDLEIQNSKNLALQAEINNLRGQKLKEVSELKIIIPNELQKTLDYVQTYSKK
jgi:hypothetical protein